MNRAVALDARRMQHVVGLGAGVDDGGFRHDETGGAGMVVHDVARIALGVGVHADVRKHAIELICRLTLRMFPAARGDPVALSTKNTTHTRVRRVAHGTRWRRLGCPHRTVNMTARYRSPCSHQEPDWADRRPE